MNLSEGLYWRIDQEVVVQCDDCEGKGYREVPRPELLSRKAYTIKQSCETCGGDEDDPGTGRITKRIEGWFEVNIKYLHATNDYAAWVKGYKHRQYYGVAKFPKGALAFLADDVIAALLNGSLPPELAKNIKEVTP